MTIAHVSVDENGNVVIGFKGPIPQECERTVTSQPVGKTPIQPASRRRNKPCYRNSYRLCHRGAERNYSGKQYERHAH